MSKGTIYPSESKTFRDTHSTVEIHQVTDHPSIPAGLGSAESRKGMALPAVVGCSGIYTALVASWDLVR